MPLKNKLSYMDNNDDELLRTNKLNENFRLINDCLSQSSQGEQLVASKTTYQLMPEQENTTEFFDVIYPVGCIIQTVNANDARLKRGIWSQVTANSLGIASDASTAGTIAYSTYYSLFLDNSSVESQVTSFLLNITLTLNGTEYSYGAPQIAAILGNIKNESDFNPNAESSAPDIGLFKFTGDEYYSFKNWCTSNSVDPYSVEAQMRWVFDSDFANVSNRCWWERWSTYYADNGYYQSESGYPGRWDATAVAFMEETDVDVATFSWMACYEMPASDGLSHLDRRIASAEDYYQALISDYSPTSTMNSPVVQRAFQELGKPYVWGACGPDSFDCSGLVSYCLCGTYGVRLGTTETFMGWPNVTGSQQPGDIVTRSDHCAVYIGLAGQLGEYGEGYDADEPLDIVAPHTGDVVKIQAVSAAFSVDGSSCKYVRYQGDVGAFTGNDPNSDSFGTNGYSTGMYVSSTSTYNVLTYQRIA